MNQFSTIHTKTLTIENNYQLITSRIQDKLNAWLEMLMLMISSSRYIAKPKGL